MRLVLFLILLIPALVYAENPVTGGRLTSGVGWRRDPISGGREYHRGYDLAVPIGTPVRPMQSGTVCYAGPRGGYGNLVAVDHHNGFTTLYGHLSRILVKLGNPVTMDTVIALSGNTGRSTGPHLHLEYRQYRTSGQATSFAQRQPEPPSQERSEQGENWVDDQIVSAKAHHETDNLLPGGWKVGM